MSSWGSSKSPWPALLTLTLAVQVLLFAACVYAGRGRWLYADNILYEIPAWNLASGRGLSVAPQEWEDPVLTRWYRAAHPEASGPYVPAAVFPPGYSFFLAGVYLFFGRNLLAAILANGLLMFATLVAMVLLIWRAYGDSLEGRVALVLVALFPHWAFWSSHVMSETLHTLLVTLFALAWFVERPSMRRTLLAGVLLGLASFTRPYTVVLPLVIALGWASRPRGSRALRSVALLACVASAPVVLWAVRNSWSFGRPMGVTSIGLGFSLWEATYEYAEMSPRELEAEAPRLLQAAGINDFHRVDENRRLLDIAFERMRQRPGRYALACLRRIPGLWLSAGTRTSVGTRMLVGGQSLLLLVAMMAGIVTVDRRGSPVLEGGLLLMAYYTAVFFLLHAEGRYTLPVRFFGVLFSAPAICRLIRAINARLHAVSPEA